VDTQDYKLELLGEIPGAWTVYLVNGREVRRNLYTDFTMGGNPLRYDFIPDGEIWIDDDLSDDERPFVIIHEATEALFMSRGFSYDDAHDQATKVEQALRTKSALKHGIPDVGYLRILEAFSTGDRT
jgi:hypothetical protein